MEAYIVPALWVVFLAFMVYTLSLRRTEEVDLHDPNMLMTGWGLVWAAIGLMALGAITAIPSTEQEELAPRLLALILPVVFMSYASVQAYIMSYRETLYLGRPLLQFSVTLSSSLIAMTGLSFLMVAPTNL